VEVTTILGIIFAVLGVGLGVLAQILMRLGQTGAKVKELSFRAELMAEKAVQDTSVKLEDISNRLEQLETGVGIGTMPAERVQDVESRLVDIEKTLEPFKNGRLDITSQEYQFLMFEIDRLFRNLKDDLREQREDLTDWQRRYEIDLDRRIGTFRTIFMISLTVVGLIVAGFGIVIFFLGQG